MKPVTAHEMRLPCYTILAWFLAASSSTAELRTVDLQGGALSLGQGYDQVIDAPKGFCVQPNVDAAAWRAITEGIQKLTVEGEIPLEVALEDAVAENVDDGISEDDDDATPAEANNTATADNDDAEPAEVADAVGDGIRNDADSLPERRELAQQVDYRLRVLDQEEYRREFESLSVSASGSYGGFSASASYSSEREYERNEFNLYAVLSVDVSNQVVGGDFFSPKGNSDSGGLIELNERKCGDSFIFAVGLGGRMELVARINTLSESERESMRLDVGGGGSFGGGGVSASASFTKMVETALERRDVHISIRSSGPWVTDNVFGLNISGGNFDLTSDDQLRKLVNSAILFPKAVNKRPWPYVGYLADYETVGYERENPILADERRRILTDLLSASRRYDRALSRVRSAEANPDIFEVIIDGKAIPAVEKLDEITAAATFLDRARKAIGDAAANCYSNIVGSSGECSLLADLQVDSNDVPATPTFGFGDLRLAIHLNDSELCSEDSSFVFPHLVPANGGCIDPNTSLVWSNPHFSVEADIAQYFCDRQSVGSGRTWQVPNEKDVRLLVSSAIAENAKRALDINAVSRLFSEEDGKLFRGTPGKPSSDNWVWAKNETGDLTRKVNVLTRASSDAGPTEIHTVICVSKIEDENLQEDEAPEEDS